MSRRKPAELIRSVELTDTGAVFNNRICPHCQIGTDFEGGALLSCGCSWCDICGLTYEAGDPLAPLDGGACVDCVLKAANAFDAENEGKI